MHDTQAISIRTRRAYAMVLVIVAMAAAIMASATYLTRSTGASARASTMTDHARARLEAESTLEGFLGYLRANPGAIGASSLPVTLQREPASGALATLAATPIDEEPTITVHIDDPSFETHTGMLPRPLLSPPMSGTVGPWELSRTGGLTNFLGIVLGATVPAIGVEASTRATDGDNFLRVTFVLNIAGGGVIRQTLDEPLMPMSRYVLAFDAGNAAVLDLLATFGCRVWAGSTLVAEQGSTELLTLLDLGGGFKRYALAFEVDDAPPSGNITIEFHVASLVGVLSSVAFDNIDLKRGPLPRLVLTVQAHAGTGSHAIEATVEQRPVEGHTEFVIIGWSEPGY